MSEDGEASNIAYSIFDDFGVAFFRDDFSEYRRFFYISFDRTRVSSAFSARDRASGRDGDGRARREYDAFSRFGFSFFIGAAFFYDEDDNQDDLDDDEDDLLFDLFYYEDILDLDGLG